MTTHAMRRRQLLRIGAGAALGVALGVGADPASPWARAATTTPVRATRAAALRTGFGEPIGRWQAGDLPHANPLPDGRTLWLLNDSFLHDDPYGPIDGGSDFVRNLAVIEDDDGLRVLGDGTSSFLADGEDRYDRWWWFHGGEIDGWLLHVVTTEMVRTGPLGWAINFEPRSTWITSIAWEDGSVIAHQPAPASGVEPIYGFSVASHGDWTYLYGNNHRYGDGTTDTRLARVPRGRLLETPRYWDGAAWVDDPDAAAVIHRAGTSDCRLHVSRAETGWVAIAKVDEFLGTDVVVWRADLPQGPWVESLRFSPPTRTGDDRTCTYDAMAMPQDDGRLLVWWSNNAFEETLVRERPSLYRPRFATVELP